jgi:hypothetical protein
MLGDLIYEAEGKLMNMRVISVEEGRPKIEVTISQNCLLRGLEVTSIVTYSSIPRELGGAIYAEGQGVIMTKEDGSDNNNSNGGGDETATWTGQGIAHYSGQRRRDVGSIFCRTSSNGKLAFLNNMVGIFEYEADENGISRGKMWEWK